MRKTVPAPDKEVGERVDRVEKRVAELAQRPEELGEVGARVRALRDELSQRLRSAKKRVDDLAEFDRRMDCVGVTVEAFLEDQLAAALQSSLPPAGNPVYVVDPFTKATYACVSPADALLPLREMWRMYPEAFRGVEYSRHEVDGLGEMRDRPSHQLDMHWLGATTTPSAASVFCVGASMKSLRQPSLRFSVTSQTKATAGFCIVYDTHGTLPDDASVMFGSVAAYPALLSSSGHQGPTFCSIKSCAVCGKTAGVMKCSGCMYAYYCGTECQLVDWRAEHKRRCTRTLLRRGTLVATGFGALTVPTP